MTTTANTVPVAQRRGDADGDNAVTSGDAQIVLQAYSMLLAGAQNPLTQEADAAADVDQDGVITAGDAQIILQYYSQNTLLHITTTWEELIAPTKND